jgi:hypothetical protein
MLGFRADAELTAAIDAAAAAEPDRPSRAEMIRRAITAWLRENGYIARKS